MQGLSYVFTNLRLIYKKLISRQSDVQARYRRRSVAQKIMRNVVDPGEMKGRISEDLVKSLKLNCIGEKTMASLLVDGFFVKMKNDKRHKADAQSRFPHLNSNTTWCVVLQIPKCALSSADETYGLGLIADKCDQSLG